MSKSKPSKCAQRTGIFVAKPRYAARAARPKSTAVQVGSLAPTRLLHYVVMKKLSENNIFLSFPAFLAFLVLSEVVFFALWIEVVKTI